MCDWIAAAAILAALQLVSGCTIVTVGEPVGEVAPLYESLKHEGLWRRRDGATVLAFVEDAEKGVVQICGLEKDISKRPPVELRCFGAQVRKMDTWLVLNVAADEFYPLPIGPETRESLKGRWLLFPLQHQEGQLILWWFEGKKAAELIDAGKLAGKVIRNGSERIEEVRIDRLEPELLERWIFVDDAEFNWRVPFVFEYLPLGSLRRN